MGIAKSTNLDHVIATRAENATLRELHAMLKAKDPGFGGLIRVLNKRNEFLWVHERFASEYYHRYAPSRRFVRFNKVFCENLRDVMRKVSNNYKGGRPITRRLSPLTTLFHHNGNHTPNPLSFARR